MAWGVLDDYRLTKVPGTTLFNKEGIDLADGVEVDPNIKKSGSIILIPQPSDSVNDPLNWYLSMRPGISYITNCSKVFNSQECNHLDPFDRLWAYCIVCIPTYSANSRVILTMFRLGPMVTPGFGEVAATYHVSFNTVSIALVGVLTLVTGTFTFFTSAAATVWGKRPMFIISTVVLLMTSVWGFYATVSPIFLQPRKVFNIKSEPRFLNGDAGNSRCS